MPATVVSTTLEGSLDRPGEANVVSGDAVDVVARLKEESEVPLRLHGQRTLDSHTQELIYRPTLH